MLHDRKIATCCYCGNRTVLNLTGKVRHELACASCGAPLRTMKSLPADTAIPTRPAGMPVEPYRPRKPQKSRHPQKHHWSNPKKRRKPKPLAKRLLDLAEDVFDAFD